MRALGSKLLLRACSPPADPAPPVAGSSSEAQDTCRALVELVQQSGAQKVVFHKAYDPDGAVTPLCCYTTVLMLLLGSDQLAN